MTENASNLRWGSSLNNSVELVKLDFRFLLKWRWALVVRSFLVWGFGDAVLVAQPFVQNELCLVHAGNTYTISENAEHLKLLMEVYDRFKTDAAFLVREMQDPRKYGIIKTRELEKGVYRLSTSSISLSTFLSSSSVSFGVRIPP